MCRHILLDSLLPAYVGVPCLTAELLASAIEKCAALGFFSFFALFLEANKRYFKKYATWN